jgi:hypothetical protein
MAKSAFITQKLKRTPLEIDNVSVAKIEGSVPLEDKETLLVARKLMEHLKLIREYEERIKAIDYLIDNAVKLSGDLKYVTKDPSMIAAIKDLGGVNNTIDFDLFRKAIDIINTGYAQMALVSLTGVKNAY